MVRGEQKKYCDHVLVLAVPRILWELFANLFQIAENRHPEMFERILFFTSFFAFILLFILNLGFHSFALIIFTSIDFFCADDNIGQ